MTELLIKLFIKDKENFKDPAVRQRYGILSSCVGIVCNVILFLVKFLVGIFFHSIAITGDAFNNLSDVGSSVITFIGFKIASQPADEDHPFGHGRIEYISGLVITFIILLVGVEIFKTSVQKIIHPVEVSFSYITVAILLISIGVKLWMGGFNKKLGNKIDSQTMKAAAADSLSDCVSTGATTIGIILSGFLPFSIDGYLGLMVGCFILYSGYGIGKETISPLLGNPPDPHLSGRVTEILLSYEIISGVHDLIIHDYGPGRLMGSAHVEVPRDCDVLLAHDAIDNAEKEILNELRMPFVIHLDPVVTENEETLEMKRKLMEIVKELDFGMSIHDFRVVKGNTHSNLIFDLVVPFSYKGEDSEIKQEIEKALECMDQKYYAVITYDRSYLF